MVLGYSHRKGCHDNFRNPMISMRHFRTYKKWLAALCIAAVAGMAPVVAPSFQTSPMQNTFSPQVAEAAAGDVILLWEGSSAPSGWTCISCASSDPFFGAFPRASSTYGAATTSADTVTHTVTNSSTTGASATITRLTGANTVGNTGAGTHTISNFTSGSGDVRPPYKNLKFIKANNPSTIPAGAIGLFDVAATSSLPSGWTYYSALDGNYLRGENATTTGGSATHTHSVSGTSGTSPTLTGSGTSGSAVVPASAHTHTISGNLTTATNAPPYVTIVFAQLGADAAAPSGLIAFFDNASLPTNWAIVSNASPYSGNFLKGSNSFGSTGGSATHTHATTTITSDAPAVAGKISGSGSSVFAGAHSHNFSFTTDSKSSLPVYRDVILGKYTNTAPDATSVTYGVGSDGGKSGDSITITGTNFGSVSAGSRATCAGGAGTGCVKFVVGGTATVADAQVTAWSSTSITFTIAAGLASEGGSAALQVNAASQADATPLTFYIYPNITALSALAANAAREYSSGDTNGLVYLTGDHFGSAGSVTVLGSTATQHGVTEGVCAANGYASTTACIEVPAAIADNSYTGNIVLTRTSDSKTFTYSTLRILPRITATSPTSAGVGTVVQISGNHLCESGTCPTSPNRSVASDNVKFGSTTSTDADFVNQTGGAGACNGAGAAWGHSEICVKVPSGTPVGSAPIVVTSNTSYTTNSQSFTVNQSAPANPSQDQPTNASTSVSTLPIFKMTATDPDSDKLQYKVTIYSNVACTAVVQTNDQASSQTGWSGQNTTCTSGSDCYTSGTQGTYTTQSALSQGTTYYWKSSVRDPLGSNTYATSTSCNSFTTASQGPPANPTQDSPSDSLQNVLVNPVFKMTATDPDSDKLQYKVTIYSNVACTAVVQTNDQASSQTGWSGQNTTCTSGSDCYTSGTQGTYTTQSALSQGTTYYWKSSVRDPLGSNTYATSTSCNSFIATNGLWVTDSGGWGISSNALTVTPGASSRVQLHAKNQSQTNGVVEAKIKASATGSTSGYGGALFRGDTGSNGYLLGNIDFVNALHRIGKVVSGSYSTVSSTAFSPSSNTFYQVRGTATGTSLQSWINGGTALSTSDGSLTGAGNLGLTAEGASGGGGTVFTVDNFASYLGTTITVNSVPGAGSWSVRDHNGTVISCRTSATWDANTYNGMVPIDYDQGGGSIAVWDSSASCSGSPSITYPSSGLSTDIFGGDTYTYTPATSGGSSSGVRASTTITIAGNGLVTY